MNKEILKRIPFPGPIMRARAFGDFIRVVSTWESIAMTTDLPVPTITHVLRGNAHGWRDHSWPRRMLSTAFLGLLAAHLLAGYPKAFHDQQRAAQRDGT